MKILETGTIWMRQASCMNDYMEVQHGTDCLAAAWNGEDGKRLAKRDSALTLRALRESGKTPDDVRVLLSVNASQG